MRSSWGPHEDLSEKLIWEIENLMQRSHEKLKTSCRNLMRNLKPHEVFLKFSWEIENLMSCDMRFLLKISWGNETKNETSWGFEILMRFLDLNIFTNKLHLGANFSYFVIHISPKSLVFEKSNFINKLYTNNTNDLCYFVKDICHDYRFV